VKKVGGRILRVLAGLTVALAGVVVLVLVFGVVTYPFQYVRRLIAWRDSDQGDYLYHFPQRALEPAPIPFRFYESPREEDVTGLLEEIFQVESFDELMEDSGTQAFIVVQDDTILYEGYFNGAQRDTMVTSFSAAKSLVSALVGIAIDEGYIQSVEDPITLYLPELAERDPRFGQITIHDLLMMAAGFEYQAFRPTIFNSDDMLTTYYPDQRKAALEFTQILDPPEEYFLYNKYHPQLLGLILERTTGVSVTEFTQTRLWDPLGMEFGGSWSLDSEESGFEKMEAGVNARAIDFAKFGRLFLNDGNWNGEQLISSRWVGDSTQIHPSTHHDGYYAVDGQTLYSKLRGYYSYMWWGLLRGEDEYDFAARGDHGQFIYVAPGKNLIIVRNGPDWGFPGSDAQAGTQWMQAFYQFVSDF
jgi:CubicO group peptidase (beta-lactamase class C family)